MLGHAFILVGNGDSSCNVRDYGSYAGGETWCAVYINSNANIAETNGLVCVSSLDIYAFIGNHAVANVCTEVIVPCTTGAIITSWRNWNKVHAALRKDKAELQKKVPSIMDRMEAAAKQNQLERLRYENMELKEALEEERSFSDRLLEGIDRVLDMLERHLPKQLLDLVDKARDLLPEHQSYRQEQQREKGHSWGDMSL